MACENNLNVRSTDLVARIDIGCAERSLDKICGVDDWSTVLFFIGLKKRWQAVSRSSLLSGLYLFHLGLHLFR